MKTGCQGGTRWANGLGFESSGRKAGRESPCIVASRPFGVVLAPGFVSARLAPHGFLGSRPTGETRGHWRFVEVQEIEDASDGREASRRLPRAASGGRARRPERESRKRRVIVWVNGPSSTPSRAGWNSL